MNETKDNLSTYTIHEAAELLHLSPITVRRYVTEGKIRGFKVGRVLRVTRAAVEDFIKAAEEKLKK
ncbi:MAG: helix-turn-helix domain-containing protein [Bacilli bacterium]|nr:helix-turn-helix domain-containing protein [Bacilli bacterium]